ncbi:hypothetical protein WA158_007975 [Blastocystis sp. Blastoise]
MQSEDIGTYENMDAKEEDNQLDKKLWIALYVSLFLLSLCGYAFSTYGAYDFFNEPSISLGVLYIVFIISFFISLISFGGMFICCKSQTKRNYWISFRLLFIIFFIKYKSIIFTNFDSEYVNKLGYKIVNYLLKTPLVTEHVQQYIYLQNYMQCCGVISQFDSLGKDSIYASSYCSTRQPEVCLYTVLNISFIIFIIQYGLYIALGAAVLSALLVIISMVKQSKVKKAENNETINEEEEETQDIEENNNYNKDQQIVFEVNGNNGFQSTVPTSITISLLPPTNTSLPTNQYIQQPSIFPSTSVNIPTQNNINTNSNGYIFPSNNNNNNNNNMNMNSFITASSIPSQIPQQFPLYTNSTTTVPPPSQQQFPSAAYNPNNNQH